jgi:drug/metabolite transporter (DMT)-like permease
MKSPRIVAFALLAAANLLWAGNWVTGRALRDAFDPITLTFWRWTVATLALAPFALPEVRAKWQIIRRSSPILLLLALAGAVAFQALVYLGLRTTTTINAVLLNSSGPLFILLCSWILERETATARQLAGMLISGFGILVIVLRGELGKLLELELHSGDVWILLAMPVWGVYSVLLKRVPRELGGLALLFVIAASGVAMLLPWFLFQTIHALPRWPSGAEVAGVLYIGLAASVAAFALWNRAVAAVGANSAGFTMHLLPAFGTLLAMIFLGEAFHTYHAAGIVTILAGVALATSQPTRRPSG